VYPVNVLIMLSILIEGGDDRDNNAITTDTGISSITSDGTKEANG
jgi:hypothetical protein